MKPPGDHRELDEAEPLTADGLRALRGQQLLGLELDPTSRRLAMTTAALDDATTRLHTLFHPVTAFTAWLVQTGAPPVLRTFDVTQLVDVVVAMGEPRLAAVHTDTTLEHSAEASVHGAQRTAADLTQPLELRAAGNGHELTVLLDFGEAHSRTVDSE